jgi:hypothetical protein
MEEQRIVGLCILDQPVHSAQNIRLGRLAHGVLLVIGEEDHIFASIAKVLVQVCGHVLHIVDTPAKLTLLTEVVDANQQRLALTSAARILEAISLRGTVTERDWGSRRRGRATTGLMDIVS